MKRAKMRLLLLNFEYPPLGGGASYQTKLLARQFAAAGHDVVILTSHGKGLPLYEYINGVHIYRVWAFRRHISRSSIVQMLAFVKMAFFPAILLHKARKFDAVLCFFLLPNGILAWMLKKFLKIPYIISLRGGDVPSATPEEIRWLHRLLKPVSRMVAKNADAIFAVSDDLAEIARKDFPGLPIPIGAINNAVEAPLPLPISRPEITTYLFVGRLTPQKNLHKLLTAFSSIKTSFVLH
ncbi:MAG: glycosyltransferase family 4 protein, partial [Candidatus Cloacimonetes bacterium]|nr:glycosyltransferase family 4 protein [Candidatus Cloacimonadota bacterium]